MRAARERTFDGGTGRCGVQASITEATNTGFGRPGSANDLVHHLLYERDDGARFTASRLLGMAQDDPRNDASLRETARPFAFYTEAIANRGGAVACVALEPAVAALVKSQTGVAAVSAGANCASFYPSVQLESRLYTSPADKTVIAVVARTRHFGDDVEKGGGRKNVLH